jgi:hypothetical protein
MTLEQGRKPNRRWIWYFVVVAGLTVLATTILVVYNLGQQLTHEQLDTARKLWDQKRPPDYVLTYTKSGSVTGTFVVTVREAKIESVLMRQNVVKDNQVKVVEQPLQREQYGSYDMDGLFHDIERFLDIDAKKGSPRTYMVATFDPQNGQLRRFVRRVMGTSNRLLIEVQPIQAPPQPAAYLAPARRLPRANQTSRGHAFATRVHSPLLAEASTASSTSCV